jgi:hypothetical protein
MIRFDYLEANKEQFREEFLNKKPFPHIGIDTFCEPEKIEALHAKIPDIQTESADYIFAKNKFEKSRFTELGSEFQELYDDFVSERFREWLCYVTDQPVFVDPRFYGGGIHQGKKGSFLDMHADFNYHPLEQTWFRNLNLLLYLNKDWKKEYKGELRLEHKDTGEATAVDVPFNRLAIMLCRGYTLHGYDPINFPEGKYRTSIAAYAYTLQDEPTESARTTEWKIEAKKSPFKYFVSKLWVPMVRLKSKISKSKTADH